MSLPTPSASWIEISKSAVRHNALFFRSVLNRNTKLAIVVKSNAYGHGMSQYMECLDWNRVDYLCCINTTEALALRKMGYTRPILVLSYEVEDELRACIQNTIDLVAVNRESLVRITHVAKKAGNLLARVHLKIDTGAGRLGEMFSDADDFIDFAHQQKNIDVVGVMSHFADAEEDPTYTRLQLARFAAIKKKYEKRGYIFHTAATAAALLHPDSHCGMVRIGIGAYGIWPSTAVEKQWSKKNPKEGLRPVLSWKTRVEYVKEFEKGVSIGYGRTFVTERKSTMAILPIGYYEGMPRSASNVGYVLIEGKRCPIRGRISMNLMTVDVTDIRKSVHSGDEVVLIGQQGSTEITACEAGTLAGTIGYESVTRLHPSIPRYITR